MYHIKASAFILIFLFSNTLFAQNFVKDQLRYQRVRTAKAEKFDLLKNEFALKNLNFPPKEILISAYKNEEVINVFVKQNNKYLHFKNYDFCYASGKLGPKRKEGDLQVPEGYYHIDRFNPSSSYYLSLGINYPNHYDKKVGEKNNLGGDIFIHGNCVSIGCIAITNDKIKELYLLSVLAKNEGQSKIPVQIFPFDLNNFYKWKKCTNEYPQHQLFWKMLKNDNKNILEFAD